MSDLLEIGKWVGSAGAGGGFVAGVIFAVKYLLNGRSNGQEHDTRFALPPVPPRPECPGKSYFEERKIEDIRQVEAFRAMVVSWDRTAEALTKQADAIEKGAQKNSDAIVTLAKMIADGRSSK